MIQQYDLSKKKYQRVNTWIKNNILPYRRNLTFNISKQYIPTSISLEQSIKHNGRPHIINLSNVIVLVKYGSYDQIVTVKEI